MNRTYCKLIKILLFIKFCDIQGNVSLRALGTPLTFQALYDATKKVPNPNKTEVAAGRTTVYDTWVQTYKSERDGRPV